MLRLIVWLLSQPLFWAGLGVLSGPFFFVRGFLLLRRQRLIADTPRSTVRGAALGQIEVSGRAVGPYTLVAPLSRTDCLYYRVIVQSNPRGDLRNRKMRELCAPFFLDDGTGKLMIYPGGSELGLPPSCDRAEYSELAFAAAGGPGAPPEFVQEYCIKPGDQIFVLGCLRENPWAKRNPATESSELSRIGPGFVSADEADLLRREIYPALDPALPAGAEIAPAAEFDLHPPVILMKGDGPFVISSDSQREIVATLHWKAVLYIWGGPVATLWGLGEILVRARDAGLLPGNF
ncbi:MAG: hypothetical protein ABSE40_10430 [Candidatus Sulfotelmatobacter sp.]|jgi:hypothetical protein